MSTTDPGDARSDRQQLAAELRRSRDLAGVPGRELARQIGISQAKVSRIESGTAMPTLPEVAAWADAVGASTETRARLTTLTEAAFTEVRTWRSVLRSGAHLQDKIRSLEADAKRTQLYQPALVPGLLQTADYARRLMALVRLPDSDDDLRSAVAARLDRQLVLYDETKRFEFLLTEAALRWRPGPVQLLLAQLDRIASVSTLGNVSIGFIPQEAEATTSPMHAFAIYEGEDDTAMVHVETIHAALHANDPDDVALYRDRWERLRRMAVFDGDAQAFLNDLRSAVRAAGN